MKVRDLLELLEGECVLALRKEDKSLQGYPNSENLICMTLSSSEGVDPYLDREIKSWGLTQKRNADTIADLFIELYQKKAEPETVDIGALAEEIINSSLQQEE